MADRIQIHIEQMEELRSQLMSLSSALHEIKSDIRHIDLERVSGSQVRVRLPSSALHCINRSLQGGDTLDCLDSVVSAVSEMGRYTHAVAGSIGMAADAFAETENRLVCRFGGLMQGESSMFQQICGIIGVNLDRSKWTPDQKKQFDDLIRTGKLVLDFGVGMLVHDGIKYFFDNSGLIATFEEKSGLTGIKQTAKIIGGTSMVEANQKRGFDTIGAKTSFDVVKQKEIENPTLYYDKDGNPIEGKKKKLGQKVDVLSVGASGGMSASILYGEGRIGNDQAWAEGSVGVGNAEFSGSVQGGLGVYLPGKDGELELYAGVDAKVGVSVSALDLKGSAEWELCDTVSLSGEGDISVLDAKAEASASFGIIGGEFMAYAKAGAEANLVEVNGEVGVDVGGVKGSVGAGVQVGVGASAEAGYKDGVISLDVSLSIGVGVSINVELDVSGLVDNVGNALESVGDAMESFADGLASICCWWG